MTADSSKPPSGGSAPPFSAQDAMEFMQRLWNPFGLPMPGFAAPADPAPTSPGGGAQGMPTMAGMPPMPGLPFPNPAAMFAALDPVEVQRKINELRVIEGWLAMSLNMMQMSIKTMELQKASLEAMRAAHTPAGGRSGAPRG